MTEQQPTQDHPKMPSPRRVLVIGSLIAIAAVASAAIGISNRAKGVQEITRWTDKQAILTVAIIKPESAPGQDELVLPGSVDAYYTGSIYARASGYVKEWYQDIGAHVKKGQILALIDTPDLDQQLAQARADLLTAQANEKLASVTADRWQALATRDIVSQQAKDEKVSDLQAKIATVQAAQANVARLESLQSFNRLVAPFDGIVTTRNVDVGDLVAAGGNSGKPLFKVADIHEMRVYVSVPQAFLGDLKPGLTASLALPQYPGKTFQATLVTTSNSLTTESRSALVELQALNLDGKLWPGAFAEVHFNLEPKANVMRIPATALFFGPRGMEVALLTPDGKVKLSKVELGRNLGNEVEILSGLSPNASVIDSPPESLTTGQIVRIAGREQEEALSDSAKAGKKEITPD
ncbi:MAG: efflux RND transporter periplasmic adaptor subunit [Beijerinckiaceae bacterium]